MMIGEKHWNWKGGKPKCLVCGKQLGRYGAKACPKHKTAMPPSRKGIALSQKTKEKMSEAKRGITPKNFGKEFKTYNKDNVNWKGDDVGYSGLHAWVKNHLGTPDTCEHCKKGGLSGQRIHWANKSQEYRRVKEDWLRLCAKCHRRYDLSVLGIKNYERNY